MMEKTWPVDSLSGGTIIREPMMPVVGRSISGIPSPSATIRSITSG